MKKIHTDRHDYEGGRGDIDRHWSTSGLNVSATFTDLDDHAAKAFLGSLTANSRNAWGTGTQDIGQFLRCCEYLGIALEGVMPIHFGSYGEQVRPSLANRYIYQRQPRRTLAIGHPPLPTSVESSSHRHFLEPRPPDGSALLP